MSKYKMMPDSRIIIMVFKCWHGDYQGYIIEKIKKFGTEDEAYLWVNKQLRKDDSSDFEYRMFRMEITDDNEDVKTSNFSFKESGIEKVGFIN